MLGKGRYNATMTKPTLVREDTAMDMQRAKSAADSQAAATPRQVALVRRACSLIDAQDCERMTLAQIARALGVSPWHLRSEERSVGHGCVSTCRCRWVALS